MCGFIGRITDSGNPDELLRSIPWVGRRGPDSQRLWSSSDKKVALLHARLAIVDKDSRAHQPLSDPDSGVTLAFVGEVYNYLELKRQFPRYLFRTESDTEVILAVYAEYGSQGISLLKGMFSLVIVDEPKRKVFLARDSVGKKPLFFSSWGNDVLFGTSLLSLVAVHKGAPELNIQSKDSFWKDAYVPFRQSALLGAQPVLPGQVLELDWSGNILSKSFLAPKALLNYQGEGLEGVNENLSFLLKTAVKRRLCDNPKPVVLLSGGIDSTVVTLAAQGVCKESGSGDLLEALTLRSLIPLTNDEFYARFAGRKIGVNLKAINPVSAKLTDAILQAIDLQDEPLGMPSFFLMEQMVRSMSSYGKILITGDGGDEIFLGYGLPRDWIDAERAKLKQPVQSVEGQLIPGWMSDYARRTIRDVLLGHMLTKADRASAEQGVEIRCPLLDYDLISYARSLPFEILTHGQRSKSLLKDQLSGWPGWFLDRPKLGFTYNLRWLWGLSGYKGLRENIDRRSVDAFRQQIPGSLQMPSENWKTRDIFSNFYSVWRLLVWSRFLIRLDQAASLS